MEATKPDKMTRETVQAALDEIRQYLQADGGDCVLVDVQGGDVLLKMVGACDGCGSATMTLTAGIENHLRDKFPDFRCVVAV